MSNFILNLPELSKKQSIGQLYGASLYLALAEYCQKNTGVKLLIAPDNLAATQIHDGLSFFMGDDFQGQTLLFFPDWETLPFDQFSPHQDIISERLQTLSRLQQLSNAIVISSVSTLMHRLSPTLFVNQHAFFLNTGERLDLLAFRSQLQEAGYFAVNKVLEHGEYAIRGSILDLYPMGSRQPYRIELFDETIESIRQFDPETQRTLGKQERVKILPAREFPLNEQSIALFRSQFREKFPGNPGNCPLYTEISEGRLIAGIEYYLPLFFKETATFFEYLPENPAIFLIENVKEKSEQFWQEVLTRHDQRNHDLSRPVLSPKDCFIETETFFAMVNRYQPLRLTHQRSEKKNACNPDIRQGPQLPFTRHSDNPCVNLLQYIEDKSRRYLFVVESPGRREVLLDLMKQADIRPKIQTNWQAFIKDEDSPQITTGLLSEGCELPEAGIVIIAEAQLFGEQAIPQRRAQQKAIDPDLIIRDLAELHLHAAVVHLDYGIGRYRGLTTIEHAGHKNEFLMLEYAEETKIYVPVTSLYLISRYSGTDSDNAPLHRLGTDRWQREKKKAQEKIHDIAIELLDLYAKRQAISGSNYALSLEDYHQFAARFPFTETPDQLRAIEDIIQDLKSTRPMDRLICGDVGFGKTEVAMRAAFVAVQNNRQVCILAPTTLLADQHYETLRDRFADFPITIDMLSRFRTPKEVENCIERLKIGKIDIIVGTHKLFSKEISFKNLGLLIIDEEHRFGVKQKEKMKTLRTEVDVLSMTATPIPRTLNMAMAGIRDVSLITTPPAKRLAIKTFWMEKNDSITREAILREILRGGQVFFLHNNVQTIDKTTQALQALVPEASVKMAHGQMRERELEKIMTDFYHHRFNVLVCTTIIETGIDIPTANTILIDRADKFGLAQLHQLRGRVGRSHHQAYAYLLTPSQKLLTKDALKRLEALVSLEDLGAGFALATHDLEIRGAGELLGEEQSGNIQAIGFSLFMELLEKAVTCLKEGKTLNLDTPLYQGPEIELKMGAILPEEYISDVHTRLIFYKRISNAKNDSELSELQAELVDRFGLLPDPAKRLLNITALKLLAASLGIKKIHATEHQAKMEFEEKPKINPATLIRLIQIQAARFQLDGPNRLKFTLEKTNPFERIQEIKQVLLSLAN